jgi:hypothetical protein
MVAPDRRTRFGKRVSVAMTASLTALLVRCVAELVQMLPFALAALILFRGILALR